jgi:hypothetical protein
VLWFSLVFLVVAILVATLPRFGIFLTQIAAFFFTGATAIMVLQILLGKT